MYDEESKRMLREILEKSRENNKILKKMRRDAIWGNVFRIIWWAVIIGVPIYLYFSFLQPIFNEVGVSFENIRENIEAFKEAIGKGVSTVTDVVDVGGNEVVPDETAE